MSGVSEQHPLELVAGFTTYPNPVRARAAVCYELDRLTPVELTVTDVTGRRVATLANGVQSAGHHSARWDASGTASGVYFCTLRAGDRASTRPLVVSR